MSGAPYLAPPGRELALSVADTWNARLEEWTTAVNTDLARRFGVPGYYVRVAPAQAVQSREAFERAVPIKNRSDDPRLAAAEQVGEDFLRLVRFGIRCADDPSSASPWLASMFAREAAATRTPTVRPTPRSRAERVIPPLSVRRAALR